MTDQTQNDDFFYGIMMLKEGKWVPHSKFDMNGLGGALAKAEDLNTDPEIEGVRVSRIPLKKSSVEPKEMWISPHLKARSEAKAAARYHEGVRKTQNQFADAHERRKADYRDD